MLGNLHVGNDILHRFQLRGAAEEQDCTAPGRTPFHVMFHETEVRQELRFQAGSKEYELHAKDMVGV